MNGLDMAKVKEIAISLHHAATTVIDQLARHERTPEALEAARLLEEGMTKAVPDAGQPSEHVLAA